MQRSSQRSPFTTRYLLALLLFAVPLGLLAWVGVDALQRQGEQAHAAVERQGLELLRSAAEALDRHLDFYLPELLGASETALRDRDPVSAARVLADGGKSPELLDLLLFDGEGKLVFPVPPPRAPAPPLHQSSRGPLAAAEILAQAGSFEAAASLLTEYVETARAQRLRRAPARSESLFQEARARFLLATCLRRMQRPENAAEQLSRAEDLRHEAAARLWTGPEWAQLALLVELARVEEGEAGDRLRAMRAIATGAHDGVFEPVLQAALRRLHAGIPEDTREAAEAADVLRADLIRRRGRAFAADHAAFLHETLRRRLPEPGDGPIYQIYAEDALSTLLVLRRATEPELRRHGCAWVGMRLDLTALLAKILDAYLQAEGRAFALGMRDLNGLPVLGGEAEVPPDLDPPALQTRYGLQLVAIPVDADELLAIERAAGRDALLLAAGLALAALSGAFLLWRSIRREVELAALKVDLVSRVSHELKTPLALIRMYAETLELGRARDDAEVERFAGIVAREAGRLTLWIDRILDFSRQQAGTLSYEPREIDLAESLKSLLQVYRPHVEAQGGSLHSELQSGLRAVVDVAGFRGAVVNLLENAVKYGLAGDDRRVDVGLREEDGTAKLEVSDRGIGVPEDERHRIFEVFHRAANSGDARGAGLGLSLVMHFARAHGGDVEALPRPGGGSIFCMTLPLGNGMA